MITCPDCSNANALRIIAESALLTANARAASTQESLDRANRLISALDAKVLRYDAAIDRLSVGRAIDCEFAREPSYFRAIALAGDDHAQGIGR